MGSRTAAVAALLALGILGALPLATAQSGVFGSQLKAGDLDYVPVTKKASVALVANEADYGESGRADDNCILMDVNGAAGAAVVKDVRLTSCLGKKPGTLIADEDAERFNPYPNVAAATLQYADANGNEKFDKGDYAYLTTKPAAGLAATAKTGTWTIRLTPTRDHPAGSFAHAGDPDFSAYGGSTKALAGSVAELEDKQWFLIPSAAGYAKGSLVPADSVRLGGPARDAASIKVASLDASPTTVAAGDTVMANAKITNEGKGSGWGVVAARINGLVVDVVGTPELAPGGNVNVTFKVRAPQQGSVGLLEVGDKFVRLELTGSTPDPAQELATLRDRVAKLESALAGLPGAAASDPGAIRAQGAESPARVAGPAVSTLLLAVLGALSLGLRGRR